MSKDEQIRFKPPGNVAEDNLVFCKLRSWKEKGHAVKDSFPGHPKQRGLTQWSNHGSMVEKQFQEKLLPPR